MIAAAIERKDVERARAAAIRGVIHLEFPRSRAALILEQKPRRKEQCGVIAAVRWMGEFPNVYKGIKRPFSCRGSVLSNLLAEPEPRVCGTRKSRVARTLKYRA